MSRERDETLKAQLKGYAIELRRRSSDHENYLSSTERSGRAILLTLSVLCLLSAAALYLLDAANFAPWIVLLAAAGLGLLLAVYAMKVRSAKLAASRSEALEHIRARVFGSHMLEDYLRRGSRQRGPSAGEMNPKSLDEFIKHFMSVCLHPETGYSFNGRSIGEYRLLSLLQLVLAQEIEGSLSIFDDDAKHNSRISIPVKALSAWTVPDLGGVERLRLYLEQSRQAHAASCGWIWALLTVSIVYGVTIYMLPLVSVLLCAVVAGALVWWIAYAANLSASILTNPGLIRQLEKDIFEGAILKDFIREREDLPAPRTGLIYRLFFHPWLLPDYEGNDSEKLLLRFPDYFLKRKPVIVVKPDDWTRARHDRFDPYIASAVMSVLFDGIEERLLQGQEDFEKW